MERGATVAGKRALDTWKEREGKEREDARRGRQAAAHVECWWGEEEGEWRGDGVGVDEDDGDGGRQAEGHAKGQRKAGLKRVASLGAGKTDLPAAAALSRIVLRASRPRRF